MNKKIKLLSVFSVLAISGAAVTVISCGNSNNSNNNHANIPTEDSTNKPVDPSVKLKQELDIKLGKLRAVVLDSKKNELASSITEKDILLQDPNDVVFSENIEKTLKLSSNDEKGELTVKITFKSNTVTSDPVTRVIKGFKTDALVQLNKIASETKISINQSLKTKSAGEVKETDVVIKLNNGAELPNDITTNITLEADDIVGILKISVQLIKNDMRADVPSLLEKGFVSNENKIESELNAIIDVVTINVLPETLTKMASDIVNSDLAAYDSEGNKLDSSIQIISTLVPNDKTGSLKASIQLTKNKIKSKSVTKNISGFVTLQQKAEAEVNKLLQKINVSISNDLRSKQAKDIVPTELVILDSENKSLAENIKSSVVFSSDDELGKLNVKVTLTITNGEITATSEEKTFKFESFLTNKQKQINELLSSISKVTLTGFENSVINNKTKEQTYKELSDILYKDPTKNFDAVLSFDTNNSGVFEKITLNENQKIVVDSIEMVGEEIEITFHLINNADSKNVITTPSKSLIINNFSARVKELEILSRAIKNISFVTPQKGYAVHFQESPTRNNNNTDYTSILKFYRNSTKTIEFSTENVLVTAEFNKIIDDLIFINLTLKDTTTNDSFTKSVAINNHFNSLPADSELSQKANTLAKVAININGINDFSTITPNKMIELLKNEDGSWDMTNFKFFDSFDNEIVLNEGEYWNVYEAKAIDQGIEFNFNINFAKYNPDNKLEPIVKSSQWLIPGKEIKVKGLKASLSTDLQSMYDDVFGTDRNQTNKLSYLSVSSLDFNNKNVLQVRDELVDTPNATIDFSDVLKPVTKINQNYLIDRSKYTISYGKTHIVASDDFGRLSLLVEVIITSNKNEALKVTKLLKVIKDDLSQFVEVPVDNSLTSEANKMTWVEYRFTDGTRRDTITAADFFNKYVKDHIKDNSIVNLIDVMYKYGSKWREESANNGVELVVQSAYPIRINSDTNYEVKWYIITYKISGYDSQGKPQYVKSKLTPQQYITQNGFKARRAGSFNKQPWIWGQNDEK